MPELPEVETTLRGIRPALEGQVVCQLVIREPRLRLPVTAGIETLVQNQAVKGLSRRGKYLLIHLAQGHVLIHLGMSGHLRVLTAAQPLKKHDHIDLILSNGAILRYHDPRRFGLWLYLPDSLEQHPLIQSLGPEPLTEDFNADYLSAKALGRKQAIKSFLMTNQIVVGVGNIYASESLFKARIHPAVAAGEVPHACFAKLTEAIKQILTQAIEAGGTTLKDFYTSEGKPGYFSQDLAVYGREGEACFDCGSRIKSIKIAGRQSCFCPQCQLKDFTNFLSDG